jgi:hypothetical protein
MLCQTGKHSSVCSRHRRTPVLRCHVSRMQRGRAELAKTYPFDGTASRALHKPLQQAKASSRRLWLRPANESVRSSGCAGAVAARRPVFTSATARRTRKRTAPTSDQIAERAYFIHLDEGGEPFGNWLRAERELAPSKRQASGFAEAAERRLRRSRSPPIGNAATMAAVEIEPLQR